MEDPDPRFEYEDIYTFGSYDPELVKTRCRHLTPIPVESAGELVAYLCPDCDVQLPGGP